MTKAFVATDTVLDRILQRKVAEVDALRADMPLAETRRRAEAAPPPLDFIGALQKPTVALIAEVKCASPSKGRLAEDFAPVLIAAAYAHNGASAVSVLTDRDFFCGDLAYLSANRRAIDIPILQKDFIIDPSQIYAGRAAGADAVLLIVAALTDGQLRELFECAGALGLTALVEVHNEWEMERALRLEARLIGINNRDLKTFRVDLNTTARLAAMTGDDVVLVAESGIFTPAQVREMGALGADAVLVGESLITAPDMVSLTRALSRQPRTRHD